MEFWAIISRAQRGLRDDLRLHVIAVASLVVAFLCLGTALLGVENLSRIAERWSRSQHLTIYLKDGAEADDVGQLRLVLESLPEVRKVEHVSSDEARALFAEQAQLGDAAKDLPSDAFPASLELDLAGGVDAARADHIAERVQHFVAVEEVETYRSFVSQFHALLDAGRSGAVMLSALVIVCVVAVIGSTIRLAVANRRREIEVLKLCGATDAFVRGPFLFEGVLQGLAASVLAMLLLSIGYFAMRGYVESTFSTLTGVRPSFLSPLTVLLVISLAGALGALGSALSLRRYLQV